MIKYNHPDFMCDDILRCECYLIGFMQFLCVHVSVFVFFICSGAKSPTILWQMEPQRDEEKGQVWREREEKETERKINLSCVLVQEKTSISQRLSEEDILSLFDHIFYFFPHPYNRPWYLSC